MRRWLIAASALAAWSVPLAQAKLLDADPQSGITIEATTPFDKIAPNGCAPVRVRIKNGSRSDGRWNLVFQSPGSRFGQLSSQNISSYFSASVASGAQREFDFLVPMPTMAPTSYPASALSLTVTGPGIRGGDENFPSISRSGGRQMGMIGFTEKLIGGQASALSQALKAKGIGEAFSSLQISQLPPDWRALSAYDQIWMMAGEWDALPVGQRLAFEQWVAAGGILTKCDPGAAHSETRSGLGEVRTVPLKDPASLDMTQLMVWINNPQRPSLGESLPAYENTWPDKNWIPPYTANAPLLILVIVLFGILVGPVNFFVFAGKEKRARIYWTTPLISVAGTIVIGLTIFVQDGFGGWGQRLALVVIQPDRHSEVLIQEQASKTAVLPSSGFSLDATALIRQLPTTKRSLNCTVNGTEYGGDWFRSRSVQGQMITAVRPTRAEIKLLNPGEATSGEPPKILSQIAERLDRVYFQAAVGQGFYRADDVGPGRETTMSPCGADEAARALKDGFFDVAGPRIRELAGFPKLEAGWFYGLSNQAPNVMLPTLNKVRWTGDRALFLCPATMSP